MIVHRGIGDATLLWISDEACDGTDIWNMAKIYTIVLGKEHEIDYNYEWFSSIWLISLPYLLDLCCDYITFHFS